MQRQKEDESVNRSMLEWNHSLPARACQYARAHYAPHCMPVSISAATKNSGKHAGRAPRRIEGRRACPRGADGEMDVCGVRCAALFDVFNELADLT